MSFKKAAFLLLASGLPTALYAVEITTNGKIKIVSDDAQYTAEIGGRLQVDYNRSELNDQVDERHVGHRRARIYVQGTLVDWAYKLQFNVYDGSEEDLYIQYKGWGKSAVATIGRQKMPFGLEALTSSKDISVLERSATSERFGLERAYGGTLKGQFDADLPGFTYAVGVFGSPISGSQRSEIGYAARLTQALEMNNDGLFHLGAAYRDDGQDNEAFGLETAVMFGHFHTQAEWVIDAKEGSVSNLDSYYLQTAYVFKGKHPYEGGIFKRVKPEAGDAWEVVVRYESGDGNYSDIELGKRTKAKSTTIGLNYYANSYVRLGLNYTGGDSKVNNDSGNELRFRAQVAF